MGQQIGRATLIPVAGPFSNLSRRAIANLWQAFNDIADGFGISKDEFTEICCDLKDEWNVSRLAVAGKATVFFAVLDTDKNGLIDALEFASTVAALSGMRLQEILQYILSIYDFDGSQLLSIDEVTLAFKSLTNGLCKLTELLPPKEEDIEHLVTRLFSDCSGSDDTDLLRLRVGDLAESLNSHPDIRSWFSFFGSPSFVTVEKQAYNVILSEVDYEHENVPEKRSTDQIDAAEWNLLSEYQEDIKEYPYQAAVEKLPAMQYYEAPQKKAPPNSALSVDWIYGYQSEKSRNNVRYNYEGNVVYHVSKYAIVYNFISHEQKIFTGHNDEIISLAMHPEGQLCGTGDIGPKPRLIVWHTVTKEIMFLEKTFHKKGVIHVAFSSDGKLLAAVGNDSYHTLSVYRWADNSILFTSQVDRGNCLSLGFLHDNTVAVGGDTFMYLWTKTFEGFEKRKGNFASFVPEQPITCIAAVHGASLDTAVVGTVSGRLSLWVDRNCVRNVHAHSGTVNCLYSSPQGLISGGMDHRVRLWTSKLEPGATFDISGFGNYPSVRSVCCSTDGRTILLGTKGACVHEISAVDGSDMRGGPIACGHSTGELRGVVTHPSKHEFLTVGDDMRLRIWDLSTHTLLKIGTFDAEIRAAAYSPLGDSICIGLGNSSDPNIPVDPMEPERNEKSGAFVIISEEDLSILFEGKDSKSPVCAAQYSPQGDTLAVAVEDGSIYLYAVQDDYEFVGKCVRHTSPVTRIDFSLDGEWMRSNAIDRSLNFWSTDDASIQNNLQSMRDVEWYKLSCPYTWHSKGVHYSVYKNEAATCVDVATPVHDAEVLVSGTAYGYVLLHNYPCTENVVSLSHRYPAHVNTVGDVKFSFDGSKLLSSGRNDRCLVQWSSNKYTKEVIEHVEKFASEEVAVPEGRGKKGTTKAAKLPPGVLPINNDIAIEAKIGLELQKEFMSTNYGSFTAAKMNTGDANETDTVLKLTPANSMWMEAVVDPSYPPAPRPDVPDVSLRLEYAYGYRSQEMRNSVRYTAEGNVVYVCSTLCVTVNTASRVQSFFTHHTDSILSFACSADGSLAATGQQGLSPFVTVWNTKTCEVITSLKEVHVNGICALKFSPDNSLLATVSLDDQYTISVYDWRCDCLVSRAFSGVQRVFDICFSSCGGSLVTCGDRTIKFWNNVQTSLISATRPLLGVLGLPFQQFLCCAYFNSYPVVSTEDGNLYLFDDKRLIRSVQAHAGPVSAMGISLQGTFLVTGGRDGTVRVWNTALDCVKDINIMEVLTTTQSAKVRSVSFSQDGRDLLIATRGAEIFEVHIADGSLKGKVLVKGHGVRALWGLATHPTKEEFATCGDDATIRIWDAKSYASVKVIPMDIGARTICYSPDGKYLAVGFGTAVRAKGKLALKEGSFTIIGCKDFKIFHEGKDCDEPLRVMTFSPNGSFLAIGSEDGNMYMYNTKEKFAFVRKIALHKAPITNIDFSTDGNYIMSVDSTLKIKYCETVSGAQLGSPIGLRDEKWATWSSCVGWPVQGLWMLLEGDTQLTAMQRSWNSTLIASGDSAGRLVVAQQPCPHRPRFISATGHAGQIAKITWGAGDGRIFTIGAKDHIILQWRVVYDDSRESGDEAGNSGDDSEVEKDGGHAYKDRAIARSKSKKQVENDPLKEKAADKKKGKTEKNDKDKKDKTPEKQKTDKGSEIVSHQQLPSWTTAICQPSVEVPEDTSSPSDRLEIEHVHGARLEDARQTLRYNEDGNIVFISSSLGIVYERASQQQQVYSGHKNALVSLDVDSSGKIAATGELHSNPQIHIWDARTAKHINIFENIHRNSVVSLSFSNSSEYLASLGEDASHCLVVFRSPSKRWTDGYVAYSASVSHAKMLWVIYVDNNAYPICIGGQNTVLFFRQSGKGAERKKGTFGKRKRIQPVLCAVRGSLIPDRETGGKQTTVLTGTVSGHLHLWSDHKVTTSIVAHENPIYSITKVNKGYATGGKDGLVKIWNGELELLHTYDVKGFAPSPLVSPALHSLCINFSHNKLLVGTRGSDVYEVSLPTHSTMLLLEGHGCKQLWGLDVSPAGEEYATVGDDGVLRIWSIALKCCLRRTYIESASRALSYSPDGLYLIIGLGGDPDNPKKDGAFVVVNSNTLDIITEDRKAKMCITDIKFHEGGPGVGGDGIRGVFAILSLDGKIYLHETDSYRILRVISVPSQSRGLSRLDFSSSGKILRVSTDKEELLYVRTANGEVISSSATMRDLKWASSTCPNTWLTQGLTRPLTDDVTLLEIAVNPQGTYVAASYQNGDVRVYRYPVTNYSTAFYELLGVATHAIKIKFTMDGKHLLVLDSYTRAIIQYKLYAEGK